MSVAVTVEGPSDKEVFRKIVRILVGDADAAVIPVRAGHGPFQGQAILDRLDEVVRGYSERKILVVVDSNLAEKAKRVVQDASPPPGKTVCILVAPWKGAEKFVEDHLPNSEVGDFRRERRAISKKKLAELFAPRLSPKKVSNNTWLSNTFVRSLKCDCPHGTVIAR